ncbi:MAG: alpha-amylase family glycosyl hydrolase [Anaerolineae bacterium]|nr:alpha-amylase family glycosyl hydrolase [Anaerolineae bacterium]MDW8170866.1 alpha-amylase family glycosyl hydrolase [Anaerolineae bacterium]
MSKHWWQTGVVYQIYPRSFKDDNGDGVGDLPGIISKLDYLNDGTPNSLGVDAIWISPFYPSPMKDFGYDVADYCDVNPLFGTLDDFDRLLAEAHKRGIRVIIDWVPNHTSDEHPWFIESRSSRDNPKADWYFWRDAKPDGSLPNNWGSHFGGPAWSYDATRSQYYLHQFDPGQPDLNWRNPQVKAAMLDVLRFWLARGVDGFRMDVVYMIMKHPDLPDQPWVNNPQARAANDLYFRQEQIYSHSHPDIFPLMHEIRTLLDSYGDKVGIGEIWIEPEKWVQYYGTPEQPGLHLPFNFRLITTPWTAEAVRAEVEFMESLIPAWGWPNYVLNNHDQQRLASRLGQQHVRNAALLLLTLRGTPTLYMGEELGMLNGHIQPDQVRDPQGLRMGLENTRDFCRTPIPWDASPNGGFGTGTPWLPVNPDYETRNVAAQQADSQSVLALYKRLIWLRKQSAALAQGRYASVASEPGIYAYTRQADDETLLVVLNFSSEARQHPVPSQAEIVLNTTLDRGGPVSGALNLSPYEGVLLKLS